MGRASAVKKVDRRAWARLMRAASRREIDLVYVWRMDRAFRSVLHASQTLEQLRGWEVGLRSHTEPWLDTIERSPMSDLLFNILASFAQFERSLITERIKAGIARAKADGKTWGGSKVHNGVPSASTERRWRRMAKLATA